MAVDGREIAARRNDINVIRLDLLILGHLRDRHRRKRLQHFGHDAGLAGAQMDDDDESHIVVVRQNGQKGLQGSSPPVNAPMLTSIGGRRLGLCH